MPADLVLGSFVDDDRRSCALYRSKLINYDRKLLTNYSQFPSEQNTGFFWPNVHSALFLRVRLKPILHSFSLFNHFLLFLLLLSTQIPISTAIRCYCTDDHCVPAYGVCESSVCLVGLRRPDLTVIRTCGDEPLGCQRNLEHWVDLCACNTAFCNTFSYLRESTQNAADSFPPPPNPLPANSQNPRDDPGFITHGAGARHHDLIMDEDTRVFQRVDGPPGEYIDEHGIRRQAPLSTRSSLLTKLFVIVPALVGAAVILVIAFNYYGHLC